MRKSLLWLLAAALILSGIALWVPPADEGQFVPAASRDAALSHPPAQSMPLAYPSRNTAPRYLPAEWPAVPLTAAKRDFFLPVLPPAPPLSPVTKVVAPTSPPPPLVEAMAPPVNYRYFGQMLDPDGTRLLYLSRGVVPLQVAVGDRLDDGYVVESVSEETIQLVYPPLGVRVQVPIPVAQR
jgi:hypothetical protein